uniref:Holliday junction nuclease RuvC n=4 Tax=cellular organisms TaxID=131567 RepID=A0A7S1DQI8_HEMAN
MVDRHTDRLGGRAAAVLDHPLRGLAGPGHGLPDGGGGRLWRPGDEGAEEGRRRALLGQPQLHHRCGRPARSRRGAVFRRARPVPLGALVLQPAAGRPLVRILGIDPGLQTTGFGVIDADGPRLAYVASGTIKTSGVAAGDLPARLKILFDGIREVVARYQPQCAAVEIVFVNVNPQSTLLLGQARGAALTALVSADLAVSEYTALQMKKAIVGHGHAKKEQIQAMVQRLLNLPGVPGKDAADALGLAVMHAHARVSFEAMSRSTTLARRQHAQFKGGRTY